MRNQQVTVNIWQMVTTSITYLALIFCAWVLLRLINACFWLPSHLAKQREKEIREQQQKLKELQRRLENIQEKPMKSPDVQPCENTNPEETKKIN